MLLVALRSLTALPLRDNVDLFASGRIYEFGDRSPRTGAGGARGIRIFRVCRERLGFTVGPQRSSNRIDDFARKMVPSVRS